MAGTIRITGKAVLSQREFTNETGDTPLPRTVRAIRHRDVLERNVIDRGSAHRSHQGTGVQGGLDPAARNEEYVLVVDGNISSLATQELLKIYGLLLETSFGTTQESGFSGRGDVSRSSSGPPRPARP